MKHPVLFYGSIVVGVFFIILGFYYFIPGIYHPFIAFTNVNHQLVNYNAHKKYSAIFFVIAAFTLLGAYLARPKKAVAR
jgi:hypothetical protein